MGWHMRRYAQDDDYERTIPDMVLFRRMIGYVLRQRRRSIMLLAAIPPFLVLAPFWLLPASLYVHLEMTAPIYIWALLISLALNKVWRRHRLSQHGLDPDLVDAIKREKDAKVHEEYIRRYGPRPEEAKRQSNTNPFF